MNKPTGTAARLRESPATHFSGPQHRFDLLQLSAHLLHEARQGATGLYLGTGAATLQ